MQPLRNMQNRGEINTAPPPQSLRPAQVPCTQPPLC